MATKPQWVVLQNSVRIEFVHTHLHTTQNEKLDELIAVIEKLVNR